MYEKSRGKKTNREKFENEQKKYKNTTDIIEKVQGTGKPFTFANTNSMLTDC